MVTLPKTNIAPENGWLEYYLTIGKAYFQGRTVSFREGNSPLIRRGYFLRGVPKGILLRFPWFLGEENSSATLFDDRINTKSPFGFFTTERPEGKIIFKNCKWG